MADDKGPNPLVVQAAKKLYTPPTSATSTDNSAWATGFDNMSDRSELVVYAGFRGADFERPTDKTQWALLYLDVRLQSWLIVLQDDIVHSERRKDPADPEGGRDFLWVKANANVLRGDGPRSNDGKFLVGDFTRAGDFAASARGGTFSAATGLLSEATTPGCCGSIRRPTK